MKRRITKVGILGSGTMGCGIAAHLANSGIQSFLLDIIPKELTKQEMENGLSLNSPQVRNRIVKNNIDQFIKKANPSLLMDKDGVHLITAGNMEDHLNWLSECDWIIEVVPENLAIKQQVISTILPYIKPGTIVSSNTSGISINKIAQNTPDDFKKFFLGTHFFNPVRYMKLLEIIPGDETLPEIVDFMSEFGERVLGKGIVICKDTPNFIANRIGAALGTNIIKLMIEMGLTVSEVDALTGPVIGRPKTATFALYDVVGLDIGVASATVVRDNVSDLKEKSNLSFPPFIYKMLEKGIIGYKSGGGFYKKQGKEKWMIDIHTLDYVPVKPADFQSLAKASKEKTLAGKLEAFFEGEDRAAQFVWEHMKAYFLNAASKIPEICDHVYYIDQALCWGYNYSYGPFEIWNGLDIKKYVERMEREGGSVPAWIKEMLELGYTSFYKEEKGVRYCYSIIEKKYVAIEHSKEMIILKELKDRNRVVKETETGTIYDIGDGIICLEMHTRTSAISDQLLDTMITAQEELETNWDGMVVTSRSKNFCVGANLKDVLSYIETQRWTDLDTLLKKSQNIYMKNKYSYKPVVMAPFAMALGGGCEIAMHSSAIQAAAETYMGLVEIGVGLIPAGGGVKEMTLRALDRIKGVNTFTNEFIVPYLQNIFTAKVSSSAKEAMRLGYIKNTDHISMNLDLLISDAKKKALYLIDSCYTPTLSKAFPAPGINDNAQGMMYAKVMLDAGMMSEYDFHIFKRLLYIMTGGNVTRGELINEQYLLDLEREVFIELCKEKKTQDRIRYMLEKGKPLRN